MDHSIFAKVLHQPNVIFAQTINSAVNQFCRTVPLCTLNMPYFTVNKLNAIWCIYYLLTRKNALNTLNRHEIMREGQRKQVCCLALQIKQIKMGSEGFKKGEWLSGWLCCCWFLHFKNFSWYKTLVTQWRNIILPKCDSRKKTFWFCSDLKLVPKYKTKWVIE